MGNLLVPVVEGACYVHIPPPMLPPEHRWHKVYTMMMVVIISVLALVMTMVAVILI
jgi:hypothetical protein